jgi:hypothetical protein
MLCLDDRDEMMFFFTKNVDYNKFLSCAGSTTLWNSSSDVLTAACTAATAKVVIFELLGLLDVNSSGLFCCLIWSLWELRIGTSARLKLYSQKLFSSVT